ncbi:MAG: SCO family protein [Deltaproteobacteria bacterium]|nr:SCO family protein [Deltaproteobacteria bacterium]
MEPRARAPLWRNPYVLAFVVGCVTVTLLRPFLRYEPKPPPVLGELPAFTLVDASGRPFGTPELAGTVWVASFFFTHCPSVCPLVMARMADLQRRFAEGGVADVRLVSITVDPERDTPEVLRAAEPRYGVDPARWTLLTGSRERLHALLVSGFKVPGLDTAALANGDIPHTTKVVLVDETGHVRGYYDTDERGIDEVFHRAQHVLKEAREHEASRAR